MALVVKKLPANARDISSIPGLGRSPGKGNGNPLQYSCLENPKDRGARWATVHVVANSQIQLKWLSMHAPVWGTEELTRQGKKKKKRPRSKKIRWPGDEQGIWSYISLRKYAPWGLADKTWSPDSAKEHCFGLGPSMAVPGRKGELAVDWPLPALKAPLCIISVLGPHYGDPGLLFLLNAWQKSM